MDATTEQKVINALSASLADHLPAALVTVIATAGSAPGKTGAMMLVRGDSTTVGTIGGGRLEHTIIGEAQRCIAIGENGELSYDLQEEAELGMSCGGRVRVFIRTFKAAPRLIIVGGGHIGLELYKIGRLQGFKTVVFDHRPELANRERFPEAQLNVTADIPAGLKQYPLQTDCFIAIATASHELDRKALEVVLDSEAAYIGMIGSARKIRATFSTLHNQGVPQETLDKVFAPMGLNIASVRPEEIALSIIGEMLLVKNNGSPDHLRKVKKI